MVGDDIIERHIAIEVEVMTVPWTIIITTASDGQIVEDQLGDSIVHRGNIIPVAVLLVEGQRVVVTIDGDGLCVNGTDRQCILSTIPCRYVECGITQQGDDDVRIISSLSSVKSLLESRVFGLAVLGDGERVSYRIKSFLVSGRNTHLTLGDKVCGDIILRNLFREISARDGEDTLFAIQDLDTTGISATQHIDMSRSYGPTPIDDGAFIRRRGCADKSVSFECDSAVVTVGIIPERILGCCDLTIFDENGTGVAS